MVNANVSAKFPTALLATEDVGVFGNNEVARLISDVTNNATTLSLDDVSSYEVHQWLSLRGPNGFEVVQIDSINLGQDQATVERAKDGTVGVAHEEGQEIKGALPAVALNQLRVDLIATQTKLGATATSGTEGGILFADASGNFAQDATNLFWHDANNQLRLAATGSSAGILIGGDAQLYRGAANKLYLASGDTLHLVSGLLESPTSLTLTPASGSNLNLAVAGAGGVQIAGTTVFESDRDVAIDLLPNADNTLDLGSTARNWANLYLKRTTGSILFIGADGLVTEDNGNFFWDNSGKQLQLPASGANAGLLIGGDALVFRGGANRLDLGASDHLHIPSGDIRFDDATMGVILKDTQGSPHYWRVTVDNTGALVTTDLGTSLPAT